VPLVILAVFVSAGTGLLQGVSLAADKAAPAPAKAAAAKDAKAAAKDTGTAAKNAKAAAKDTNATEGRTPADTATAHPARPEHEDGFYLNPWWLALLVVTCGVWLALVDWVNKDSTEFHMASTAWNIFMYVPGAAGLGLTWFYGPGACIMTLVVVLACTAIYVQFRNRKVPDEKKIGTREHLRLRLVAFLHLLHIRVNPRTFLRRQTPGREIQFLTTSGTRIDTGALERGRPRGMEGMAIVKEILAAALDSRASVIQFQPKGNTVKILLGIDGVMHDRFSHPWDLGDPASTIVKTMAGIDPSVRTKPQAGSFAVNVGERVLTVRANTSLSVQGESLFLRLEDKNAPLRPLDKLGMPKGMLERVRALLKQPRGLILLASPRGTGRTTTLYALLRELADSRPGVSSIERIVERRLPKVKQYSFGPKTGATYAEVLRKIAPKKGGAVVLDDLPNLAAASAAVSAAGGCLVIAGIDALNAPAAVYKLINMGVNLEYLSERLLAVLGQRLVRLLCPHCRVAYDVNILALGKMGVKADGPAKIYRPGGCAACLNIGYRGRTGVFELLELQQDLRKLMRRKAPQQKFAVEARRQRFSNMRMSGLRIVLAGRTSDEELGRVLRVTVG